MDRARAVTFLAHCQRFYPFRLYRVLTDNGREFTLRGYRGRSGARTTKVYPFPQRCRCGQIRHSLTKAYHPWIHGLVERTGGTIKAEPVYRWHFDSTAMLAAGPMASTAISTSIAPTKLWAGKHPHN